MKLDIDRRAPHRGARRLGAISQEPAPVVTRVVFTEADVEARTYVKKLCREAGLEVREDAIGNTFARWTGEHPDLAPVGTGSHIDAIPNAGRFDGTVGVLGALEAIRALARAGYKPRRSIELIIFTSEEPTRFGIGCLGSRLLSGLLDPVATGMRTDRDGVSLDNARWAAGFVGPLASVSLGRRDTIRPSLKCTSSKGRSWNSTTFRSASLRPSPRLPASKSTLKVKADTRAPC